MTRIKVDLVMWSKHGAKQGVLERISKVIPAECVNNRFLVVDAYGDLPDGFKEYAESLGWGFVLNKGVSVCGAANTVLAYVTTDYFASFEDDLLLSHGWWHRISGLRGFAVASGLRVSSNPSYVCALQRYLAGKYLCEQPSWLRSKAGSFGLFGKTLDNTVYDAEVLRGLGGFPYSVSPDTDLAHLLTKEGYVWRVLPDVISVHLRSGLRSELKRQRLYGSQGIASRGKALFDCAASPFAGLLVSVKVSAPKLCVAYPLLKLAYLRGVLSG